MSGHGSSTKAILYAFLANLGIAVIKTGAAIYTGSGSMLAEAIHSFADTGNQMLLFLGLYRSKKEADPEHPLGYGKSIYFWSFIVAIMLFSLGGLFSIYEGIHKLDAGEKMEEAWVALLVLAISIVLEGGSLYGATKEIIKRKGSMSFRSWISQSRDAELIVVFGEDMAAISGLTLAFLFILAAHITGNPMFDAAGSIVIGGILIIVSIFVGTRVKGMLIGRSAEPAIEARIRDIITDRTEINRIFNMLTVQLGPDIMIAAKIQLKGNPGIVEVSEIINETEKQIKKTIPSVRWIFIEPDITD